MQDKVSNEKNSYESQSKEISTTKQPHVGLLG
jgi:hypothetical protein